MVHKLAIIGSSAGGPRILKELFSRLPRLNGAIVLVQHMPKFINESLCETIQDDTEMDVHLIGQDTAIRNHGIYVAPSEIHTAFNQNGRFHLFEGERHNYVKPSVDVVMQSVRRGQFEKILGVILTGMGKDGAEGIRHLKSLGATTVAQNEESCAIFGMPKEAIDTGCVDYVLDPSDIRRKMIATLGA